MTRYPPIAFLLAGLLGQPAAPLLANAAAQAPAKACSLDSMPEDEKRRMMAGYLRRIREQGKTSADAWANEQGDHYRDRLVAEGVCPPLPGQEGRVARRRSPPPAPGTKPLLDKQGKPCTKIGVENQVFPSFGDAPMTMSVVPVCEN